MPDSDLDPVVKKAMGVVLENSNPTQIHSDDVGKWVSLFTVLAEAGFTWHEDDIDGWLQENWLLADDEDFTEDSEAARVSAWAEMAQEQLRQKEQQGGWSVWAESIIQQCIDELRE